MTEFRMRRVQKPQNRMPKRVYQPRNPYVQRQMQGTMPKQPVQAPPMALRN